MCIRDRHYFEPRVISEANLADALSLIHILSKNRANMRRRVESGDDVSFAVIHNDFSTAGREMLYSFL